MRFRGAFTGLAIAVAVAFAACSDDEAAPPAGFPPGVGTYAPPVPPDPPVEDKIVSDLLSRVADYLGNAELIADVGEPTDGIAWRDSDSAIYFTVPNSPTPLRRLVPGGTPTIVTYDAGGTGPIGLANNGGDRFYVTEREALVVMDLDADGGVAATTRSAGDGGTAFGDITHVERDAGTFYAFVDTSTTTVYAATPAGEITRPAVFPSELGEGRFISIASYPIGGAVQGVKTAEWTTAVGATDTKAGTVVVHVGNFDGDLTPFQYQAGAPVVDVPANGLATDTNLTLYVAWAAGIQVFPYGTARVKVYGGGRAHLRIDAAPTNIAFGGADRKTLFVATAAGKIYAVPTRTPGILR